MNEPEAENLIERGLSVGRPCGEFRNQLLADSTAALVQGRRAQAQWRTAGLAVAAVVIATVSFLCGRSSVSHPGGQPPFAAGPVPSQAETIRVSTELVTWLQAARFFKQLGMQERVTLAYERASRLLPCETVVTSDGVGQMLATEHGATREEQADGKTELTVESVRRIMAQSLGG